MWLAICRWRRLDVIPGHEIVGLVEEIGLGVRTREFGQRVGVGWLSRTCGACHDCREGEENLCDDPLLTGWSRDRGFAEPTVADARSCFPLPTSYSDAQAALLMCAGLIGYRA